MTAVSLWTVQGMAQEESEIILPHGKCGTSMIIEQKRAANGIASRAIGSFYPSYVPHTGSITIPVILVNFKDVQRLLNSFSMVQSKRVWAMVMPRIMVPSPSISQK